jgi:threonine dehydratase
VRRTPRARWPPASAIDFVPDTICDGLRGTLGQPNFELLRARAEVIVVDDAAVVAAMRLLWEVLKQVVEPSSATVLAAVLAQPQRFAGLRVGLVLSGGNVDIDALHGAGMSRAARGAGIAAGGCAAAVLLVLWLPA